MLAKVVIVKAEERFVMAVLPSHWRIDFDRLRAALGAHAVRLATEDEEIVFQAGTHHGAVKPWYQDFANVVCPTVAEFHRVPAKIAMHITSGRSGSELGGERSATL